MTGMVNQWGMQGTEKKLLDHGYVRVIELWGSDQRVVESARMSTGKDFKGWGPHEGVCKRCGAKESEAKEKAVQVGKARSFCEEDVAGNHDWERKPGDEKLLGYLWKNQHTTPFEMAGLTVEVQAPIFVFREWHRHRTQSYSEASARYEPLPDLNYVPSIERCLMGGGHLTKQAGSVAGAEELNAAGAELFRHLLIEEYERCQQTYERALKGGIPKELARLVLPVGRYSKMRASTDLLNWLKFLKLRMDATAQWEIRQYAEAVGEIVAFNFPRVWEFFLESRAK